MPSGLTGFLAFNFKPVEFGRDLVLVQTIFIYEKNYADADVIRRKMDGGRLGPGFSLGKSDTST